MARTTISELVEGIRRELNSINRYEVSTLGASISASATTVTLTYDLPPSLRAGAVVTVGVESMRVMDVTPAAKEILVIRGWEGSEPVVHSAGDEVWINPRFTATKIYEALHDECLALPDSLYRVARAQVPVLDGADTVELPATWQHMYGLIDARKYLIDPVTQAGANRTVWPRVEGRIYRADPTVWTEGPSTGVYFRFAKRVSNWTGTSTVGSVLFTAALPFDLTGFATEADLVDDFGMLASMTDVLRMGVKIRLMPDEEIGRSDRRGQDEARRADEVPPGTADRPVRTLFAMYMRRRQEEASRLRTQFPIRMA